MKAVILAAGVGGRLGKQLPKCLTALPNGRTILENQIDAVRKLGIKEIVVVVGFKKELIMERHLNVIYVYNPMFHVTNTAKSLEKTLELIEPDDIVWINGDVYLEEKVIEKVIQEDGNAVAVNKSNCGEEEVKYKTDCKGRITAISKKIINAEGEAVGVNKITKKDFHPFLQNLGKCTDADYFENAIEISIEEGIIFKSVDVSDYKCLEVDFQEDLELVRRMF